MDVIDIEILADGTIKSSTDVISPVNHTSADKFFALLERLTGGICSRKRRGSKVHVHQHDGVTHSH